MIAKRTLRECWEQPNNQDAEEPLKAWHSEAKAANWKTPADVRALYGSASFVGDRVVFNIAGNKYRLVVQVRYDVQIVFIRFVGTHREYDNIDVTTI